MELAYVDKTLFIKLAEDGTATWEENVTATSHRRHVSKISKEDTAAIAQRLSAIQAHGIEARMGPYDTYTDTSVELRITALQMERITRFTVWNPTGCQGPNCIPGGLKKPVPENVRSIVCESVSLRIRMTSEPTSQFCSTTAETK
jgi:hypothetical protein